MPVGDGLLQLAVVDDAAGDGVDEQHLARLQTPLLDDAFGVDLDRPDLGGADDAVVVGDVVPARPQAVPVEVGAAVSAVREGEERGAVPGLHHAGGPLVEGGLVRVHRRVVLPRLRHHEHDGLGQGQHTVDDEQLQHVVEGGRVGAAVLDDRVQLVELVAEEIGAEDALAGPHPVLVPPKGVDLACSSVSGAGGGAGGGPNRTATERSGPDGSHRCGRPNAAAARDPSWGKY